MTVKLLNEQHLEFLSLTCVPKGCTGSSESTLVKMAHCWKSHVVAHYFLVYNSKAKSYVIVIPWLVRLYMGIIYEPERVDYLMYRWTNMV